ncbi:hypothetical protein JX265_001133 [Neoarthrinium moseri]|uniref:Heterokaryon incompatibility domain-containing protein n=1 Tax=Neoarthrinium moseri TaxID=1658444 RepID=A0A9P9WX39_9PEZI|nr:hypothetical protein JX265_001133 [Neoarthrinium moseri]
MLPTRLVEIRPDYERDVVSSNLTSQPGEDFRYATLSHCWGKLAMFTLKRDKLEELQVRIPSQQVAKTFRDAVDITRRIGLKYRWIDSLCILQDDDGDWSREAVLMSEIYGSSSLNIAATGAADGRVGCYQERGPAAVAAQQLTASDQTGSQAFDRFNFDIYRQNIVESPLFIWECGQKLACETFSEDMPSPLSTQHAWFQKRKSNLNVWIDTVTQYSRCNPTDPWDKLIAISGISNWLQGKTNDEYIAGLWLKYIEHQMVWCTEDGAVTRRPAGFRAPSWSWPSIDGLIRWPFWGGVHLEISIAVIQVIEVLKLNSRSRTSYESAGLLIRCLGVRNASRSSILDTPSHGDKLVKSFDAGTPDTEYKALQITVRAPKRATDCLAAGLLVEEVGLSIYRHVGMFRITAAYGAPGHVRTRLAPRKVSRSATAIGPVAEDGLEEEIITLV